MTNALPATNPSNQANFKRYLVAYRDNLLNASKKLLHNQTHGEFIVKEDHVLLIDAPRSLHKQLFSLMLKTQWEMDDLQLILAFCACINLKSNMTSPLVADEGDREPIHDICSGLWKAAFITPVHNTTTKAPRYFVIHGIEKIVPIDDPLLFSTTLPVHSDVFSNSADGFCFKQDSIVYHANVPFTQYKNVRIPEDEGLSYHGESFRVSRAPTSKDAINTFRHVGRQSPPSFAQALGESLHKKTSHATFGNHEEHIYHTKNSPE
jgi:hypothetical protein